MQPIPPNSTVKTCEMLAEGDVAQKCQELSSDGYTIVAILPAGFGAQDLDHAPFYLVVAYKTAQADSPEGLPLALARELVRQEEAGVRVNSVCECKGSALGVENVQRHRRGTDACLYQIALDVLVAAGERGKGAGA